MSKKRSLIVILVLSIAGMLFSGYLSYYELFANGCSEAIISCGSSDFSLANLPSCVYGFVMYAVVFVTSALGLRSKT